MRFFIHSKTWGTYLAPSYGGEFFSGYGASTFTNMATTWQCVQAAQDYIVSRLSGEDDPQDLEVLAVNSAADFATMDECVAAGADEWKHHIKCSANNTN